MGSVEGGNETPLPRTSSFSDLNPFCTSTPRRRTYMTQAQLSSQKRRLEALELESASKARKQASEIDSLKQRIDKLELDRKQLFDENQKLVYEVKQLRLNEVKTIEDLHSEVDSLKQKLEQTEEELRRTQKDYSTAEFKLNEKISDLNLQTSQARIKVESYDQQVSCF